MRIHLADLFTVACQRESYRKAAMWVFEPGSRESLYKIPLPLLRPRLAFEKPFP